MPVKLNERIAKAKEMAEKVEREQRVHARLERDKKRKTDNYKRFMLGDLVMEIFPDKVAAITVHRGKGAAAKNAAELAEMKCFLLTLAADKEMMASLKEVVRQKMSAETL
jgi:predicted butyrate kinase (DUF1464 family)